MYEASSTLQPLIAAADAIAPLNITGCNELARMLDGIAHATSPDPVRVHQAMVLAVDVRSRLRADADPNRWISEFEVADINVDMIAALVSERLAQTERVQAAIDALKTLVPVPA